MTTQVETLLDKAAAAERPDHAMHFSQAALNAANALCVLANKDKNPPQHRHP
jgi:hypothetical protein